MKSKKILKKNKNNQKVLENYIYEKVQQRIN